MKELTRRELMRQGSIGAGLLAAGGGAFATSRGVSASPFPAAPQQTGPHEHIGPHSSATVGAVGDNAIGVQPEVFLREFDYGKVEELPNGQTLRTWNIVAVDREIEIAPGVFFPAWTYNGRVPGPTLRCTEGDRMRVIFNNAGSHPHTIHFHGIHPPSMDGVEPLVHPGESFTYEFDARPFGLHPYHCHAIPLKRHIHKGLYGALVIDPPNGRPDADEMVMVMNGFDTNFDGGNEVYAVNSVAFHFMHRPIQVERNKLIRIYLLNLTEFDLINSFHLHAGFFKLFRTGTRLDAFEWTDTVMLCQGERSVLEFTLEDPGKYMFHAHQSEFAELGWMGFLEAPDVSASIAAAATTAGEEVCHGG